MCVEKKALKERLGTIMKHKRFSRTSIVLSCIMLAAVIGSTIVLGASSITNDNRAPEFPVNANNPTYGSVQHASSTDTLPDLIEAGRIDQVDVYIYTRDILDLMPKTLEEMQEGNFLNAIIPLYEADGKTVAGSADYSFGLQFIPVSMRSEYAIPPYAVNENGQTYGTMAWSGPHNPVTPDLIACIGIDGTEGYCYSTDLDGEQPDNPDDAMKYMNRLEERYEEMRRNGEQYERIIPLYTEDGVTVIGAFGIGGLSSNYGSSRDYTTPEPPVSIDDVKSIQPSTPRTGDGVFALYYAERRIDDVTLHVGESVRFGWKFAAGKELKDQLKIQWESSNESVFTVDSMSGEIIAIGRGTAVCTATAEYLAIDGTDVYKTAECIIRVR